MKKKEIIKDYKKKIDQFKKFNQAYYDKDKPVISDAKFDQIKLELINLEKKFSYLKSEFSPTTTVGFKPSKNFKKVAHKVPMLSLGNAFKEEDLQNFEKKILNFLNKSNEFILEYSVELIKTEIL